MSDLTLTSPMIEIDFSQLGTHPDILNIKEHAFLGHINLRGSSENTAFTTAVKKVFGTELPMDANTFVQAGENTILWLGPNEWGVIVLAENVRDLVSQFETEVSDTFAAINDVSGGNTILELSGDRARALLLKGCPLDLHHSVFSAGQCAQTVIAKTDMTLWQVDDAPTYKLIVRRSFADYLGLWLLDAAKEYRS